MTLKKKRYLRSRLYCLIRDELGIDSAGYTLKEQLRVVAEWRHIELPTKGFTAKVQWSTLEKWWNTRDDLFPPDSRPKIWDPKWKLLRNTVLKKYGRVCMKCSSTVKIQVDHIKPVSLYPLLAYDLDNLQVLCRKCNIRKSNKGETDYRGVK